jgi:hypothetical protein
MLWGLIFTLIFFSAAAYVVVKGDSFQRCAIGVMMFGVVATFFAYKLGSHKWLPLNISVLLIDALALLAFGLIALRSRQFWPLLLVGWQIAAVTIHVASSFALNLLPKAYGISQGIWAYLQFGTIFVATIMARRKQK